MSKAQFVILLQINGLVHEGTAFAKTQVELTNPAIPHAKRNHSHGTKPSLVPNTVLNGLVSKSNRSLIDLLSYPVKNLDASYN